MLSPAAIIRFPMSQENVELVRRAVGAFAEDLAVGAFGRRLPEVAHPDIEWRPLEATRPFRGYEEVAAAWREWSESMDQLSSELEEVIDAGRSAVVAVVRGVARGVSSGATVAERIYPVFTVRGKRIARYVEYATREEALQSARTAS